MVFYHLQSEKARAYFSDLLRNKNCECTGKKTQA